MHRFADIRFAFRTLVKRPILAATVVGTLAIAIAFNVASASALTALLERPFPYPDLDALLMVRDARPREGVHQGHAIAAADFIDLSRSLSAFQHLTAWRPASVVIGSAGSKPEPIETAAVTANFFSTLGGMRILGQ